MKKIQLEIDDNQYRVIREALKLYTERDMDTEEDICIAKDIVEVVDDRLRKLENKKTGAISNIKPLFSSKKQKLCICNVSEI